MSGPATHGLLVIGSGPGGVAAAIAYRDHDGAGPVTLVSSDGDLPYERPPLSKDMLRGASRPEDARLHPRAYYADRDIGLRLGTAVRALDAENQNVTLDTGEVLGYDACVLGTGAAPQRPPVPGADLPEAFTLRSLQDGIALRNAAARATHAVVTGSGFIGCEAAASLAARGLDVTLVTDEQRPHAARLGEWAAGQIADWLRDAGITLMTGDRIAKISRDRGSRVRTELGAVVPADLVLLATGVRPRVELAADAGIATDQGRVRVDASMRSSARQVFAVGDVALAHNASDGRAVTVEHWGDALAMGEIAGQVAAGEDAEWSAAPGFWSTIGDRTLKYTAWGDGFDDVQVDAGADRFVVRYVRAGRIVGVLTHQDDDAYERGQRQVRDGEPAG